MIRRNSLSLAWDAEGQLLSANDGVWHTTYRYDALGRRIAKTRSMATQAGMPRDPEPARETRFVWQGMRLLQEQDGDGRCRTYLYDPEREYAPLARVDHTRRAGQGTVYHYHTEPNGTARAITDDDGRRVWHGNYSAWGQVRSNEVAASGFSQLLRMPGQYWDEETGLHYNLYRYYEADAGRFVSPDPIGLVGGLSLYQFAPNPISWIDALGLITEWVDPKTINFSQRTISGNNYAELMRTGRWNWQQSPLTVMDVKGQLVTYDNRRLDAALEAGQEKVPINVVDPTSVHPNSTTGKTWHEKFQQRFNDPRNVRAGGAVPETGVSTRPGRC